MRKLILISLLGASLCAQQLNSGWYLNLFLYMEFFGNPVEYQMLVDSGEPCYIWLGTGRPTKAPVCFYNPNVIQERTQ